MTTQFGPDGWSVQLDGQERFIKIPPVNLEGVPTLTKPKCSNVDVPTTIEGVIVGEDLGDEFYKWASEHLVQEPPEGEVSYFKWWGPIAYRGWTLYGVFTMITPSQCQVKGANTRKWKFGEVMAYNWERFKDWVLRRG